MTQIKAFKNYEQLLNHFNQLNATIEQLTLDKQKLTTMVAETQVEKSQLKADKEKLETSNKQLVVNNQQMLKEIEKLNNEQEKYLPHIELMKQQVAKIQQSFELKESQYTTYISNLTQQVQQLKQVLLQSDPLELVYQEFVNAYPQLKDYLSQIKNSVLIFKKSNPFAQLSLEQINKYFIDNLNAYGQKIINR